MPGVLVIERIEEVGDEHRRAEKDGIYHTRAQYPAPSRLRTNE